MAATDGQINGTELGVYIGGTLIAYSTNATINNPDNGWIETNE